MTIRSASPSFAIVSVRSEFASTATALNSRDSVLTVMFAEGSMKPKVQAGIDFGKKTIITSINKAELALAGKAGTVIYS